MGKKPAPSVIRDLLSLFKIFLCSIIDDFRLLSSFQLSQYERLNHKMMEGNRQTKKNISLCSLSLCGEVKKDKE